MSLKCTLPQTRQNWKWVSLLKVDSLNTERKIKSNMFYVSTGMRESSTHIHDGTVMNDGHTNKIIVFSFFFCSTFGGCECNGASHSNNSLSRCASIPSRFFVFFFCSLSLFSCSHTAVVAACYLCYYSSMQSIWAIISSVFLRSTQYKMYIVGDRCTLCKQLKYSHEHFNTRTIVMYARFVYIASHHKPSQPVSQSASLLFDE